MFLSLTHSHLHSGSIFKRDLDKLFKEYDVQENIDLLHKVVNEAKDRSLRGDTGNDVWKEGLEPRTGIAARTVPILKTEMDRLHESVEQVRFYAGYQTN